MLWNDAALALELDSGQYLNIVAQSGGIQCSLDDTAAAGAGPESDEDVLFELDGHKMLWHKAALRDKYVDTALQRLWFGSNVVWVYTHSGILACHLVESYPEGIRWLLWIEGD